MEEGVSVKSSFFIYVCNVQFGVIAFYSPTSQPLSTAADFEPKTFDCVNLHTCMCLTTNTICLFQHFVMCTQCLS